MTLMLNILYKKYIIPDVQSGEDMIPVDKQGVWV
jgi:hypothetical protein